MNLKGVVTTYQAGQRQNEFRQIVEGFVVFSKNLKAIIICKSFKNMDTIVPICIRESPLFCGRNAVVQSLLPIQSNYEPQKG